jgi:hypothetical protein
MKDGALSAKVAMTSHEDAGCPVQWRPLRKVGMSSTSTLRVIWPPSPLASPVPAPSSQLS